MARPRSNKGRYNFLIDSDVYEEFSRICEQRGLVRSKQVELLLREFIKRQGGKQ
ncbi:hypothetical protein GF342_04895 [Candidatus Woesearchaeota archaeon]|nr:hypothetical protein [Candidatus Woesearchaeota archaeon]